MHRVINQTPGKRDSRSNKESSVRSVGNAPIMSLSRLLRRFSQPNLSRSTSADVRRTPSSDNSDEAPHQRRQPSGPMSIIPRSWKRSRKERATTSNQTDSSQATSTLPLSSKVENPTSDAGIHQMPSPSPLPAAGPNVPLTNLSMVPHTEIVPVRNLVSDTLAEAWNAVNDGPSDSNTSRRLNAVGASSVPVPSVRFSAVS